MDLDQRISAFISLGHRLSEIPEDTMSMLYTNAYNENNWFTQKSVLEALNGIGQYLDEKRLKQWLRKYDFGKLDSQKIGVIMAGNIPLVGFHDLMSILISGHKLMMKPSSQDNVLMSFVVRALIEIESGFEDRIEVVERLNDADAFIGTGSDNSARYFKHYFGKKPHIIRQNRTAVGVLTGKESNDELKALGIDVFTYYGLGCRNVSKLLVPKDYDFIKLLDAQSDFAYAGDHHKYRNNYDYNKSIYLVNGEPHLDTGFSLLRESEEFVSPISVLYYQHYDDQSELEQILSSNAEKIQCVVGQSYIPFGQAQQPELWDYADGVDTLEFLAGL